MRITRRAALAALGMPAIARAQDGFPNRAVRLIVPYSAGGIADTVARIVQPKVGEALGQSLIVENKTGASGALGAAAAAQAPPDGYTLVLEGATTITSPLVNKSLPLDYDMLVPVTQLTAACSAATIAGGSPAGPNSAAHSLESKPGKPLSAIVGTSGRLGTLSSVATARKRARPLSTMGPALTVVMKTASIRPAARSRAASAPPR